MTSLTSPEPESYYAIKKTIIDSLTHEIKALNDKTTSNGVTAENFKYAIIAGTERAAQEIINEGSGGPATNLMDSTVEQHIQGIEEELIAKQKDLEALMTRVENLEDMVMD